MASKTPLMREIESNWRQTKPDLHAQLKAKGTLSATLQDEANRMTAEIDALTAGGMRLAEAEEIVRPEYLTQPSREKPMDPADAKALRERHETFLAVNGIFPADPDEGVIVRETKPK